MKRGFLAKLRRELEKQGMIEKEITLRELIRKYSNEFYGRPF